MEREKINSKCEFDWQKNNRLSYKCRECREIQYDSINGLIKNQVLALGTFTKSKKEPTRKEKSAVIKFRRAKGKFKVIQGKL